MLGQSKLKYRVSQLDKDTFPQTLLLVAPVGCGKHTLVTEYILPKLNNIDVRDITDVISYDTLLGIELGLIPTLYEIDLDKLTERKQNILLKLLEEPKASVYLVLFSSNLTSVLSTIQNRCQIWTFENYTEEELLQFGSKELIKWIKSPGILLQNKDLNISYVEDLCTKILTVAKKAQLFNLLSITNKIDWGNNNPDLINPLIFYSILVKTCLELVSKNLISSKVYKLTNSYINSFLSSIQFDRKRLFEKYLVELKYGEL